MPMLIAFYASMAQCAYLSDAALDPAPELNVAGPSRAGVTFMTLTNAAFLVSQACCESPDQSDCRPGRAVASETPHVAGRHSRPFCCCCCVSCLPVMRSPPCAAGHSGQLCDWCGALQHRYGAAGDLIRPAGCGPHIRKVRVARVMLCGQKHTHACMMTQHSISGASGSTHLSIQGLHAGGARAEIMRQGFAQ